MVASVTKYKGFYVGRYEMSLDENKKAKSKVGVIPATAMEDSANTWHGLYAYQKKMAEDNNYASVKSHMIWGSNYDAMLRWMLNGADAAKVISTENADHDLSALYETGKVTIEGKTDKINNVYDLEGNGHEWTAAACYDRNRCYRGGLFSKDFTPEYQLSTYTGETGTSAYCSRCILYIK